MMMLSGLCTKPTRHGQRLDVCNFGNHEICQKHGQLCHQSVCGNFGKYKCVKWYLEETHTIANANTTMWIDLVVSLCARIKNLQGDS